MKKLTTLVLSLVMWLFLVSAFAIGIRVDKVEINGYSSLGTANPLYIERSDELNLDLWFTAPQDYKNVQVYAFINGYEFGEIRDYTPVFDVKKGLMYHKTLKLELPKILEVGHYKLRIIFADRSGTISDSTYELDLYVSAARNLLEVRNLMIMPGKVVKQGDSLLVAARVENMGEKDERDVKVTVEIPKLGVYQVDYIDLIKSGEILSSDYVMLNIPNCANPGQYDIKVTLSYNRNSISTTYVDKINIVDSGACLATTTPSVKSERKTLITLSSKVNEVAAGETATYAFTITNQGERDVVYKIQAVVPGEWASVRVAPASTIVLKAGEQKTVFVAVTPKRGVEGAQMFNVVIKVDEDEVKEIPLTTYVEGTSESNVALLQLAIVVLIVVLIVLGIIVGAIKASKKKEEKKDEDTYY